MTPKKLDESAFLLYANNHRGELERTNNSMKIDERK